MKDPTWGSKAPLRALSVTEREDPPDQNFPPFQSYKDLEGQVFLNFFPRGWIVSQITDPTEKWSGKLLVCAVLVSTAQIHSH